MDLQIRAIKKKNFNKKILALSKEEKLKKKESEKKSQALSHQTTFSSPFNVFTFFKETPEKLMDFPLSSLAQTKKNSPWLNEKINAVRRKKINHHEETYPLFSRI